MKSDFSRFLHITSSYSGLTRISRWNKFANWFDLDTPIKSECDTMGTDATTCRGRSMVEMLGVLAVIGVLSVGAIAGYSKAMMKYKLNKQAESFSMLLNNALQLTEDLTKTVKRTSYIGPDFFAKANLLPDGMRYNASDNRIYDVFNNKISLYYNNNTNVRVYDYVFLIDMEQAGTKISGRSREICRNIALTAKENAANLYSFRMRSSMESGYTENSLFGGLSSVNYNLLQNATLKQIDDMCASCDSEVGCEIVIYLNVIPY